MLVSFPLPLLPCQRYPSLITSTIQQLCSINPQPRIHLAIPFPLPRLLSTAEENTIITCGDTKIYVWPAGPHVIGDTFIYFLVGLCSLFLTAGVSDLHSLPQGSFLSTHDSPLWHRGSEGGRASSQKLPTPHPPGLPNPTLPFTSL